MNPLLTDHISHIYLNSFHGALETCQIASYMSCKYIIVFVGMKSYPKPETPLLLSGNTILSPTKKNVTFTFYSSYTVHNQF